MRKITSPQCLLHLPTFNLTNGACLWIMATISFVWYLPAKISFLLHSAYTLSSDLQCFSRIIGRVLLTQACVFDTRPNLYHLCARSFWTTAWPPPPKVKAVTIWASSLFNSRSLRVYHQLQQINDHDFCARLSQRFLPSRAHAQSPVFNAFSPFLGSGPILTHDIVGDLQNPQRQWVYKPQPLSR